MKKSTAKPYEGNSPYVFVSYCHKDRRFVFPIIERLTRNGYRVWYDEGITPGSEWNEVIATHMSNSSLCVAFISKNAAASHNCRREINYALLKNKPLLSVFLEKTDLSPGMEMQLSANQCVYAYSYEDMDKCFKGITSLEAFASCLGEPDLSVEVRFPSFYDETSQSNDKKPKEDGGGGKPYGGDDPVPAPPKLDNPPDNSPSIKKVKPKHENSIKVKPIHKPDDSSKKVISKKALKITGIVAAVFAAVLIGLFAVNAIVDLANKVTIAGDKYDLSDVTVVVTEKNLTPDDITQLSKMTSLRTLKLVDCGLDSGIIETVASLENISILDLSVNPGITDCSALSGLMKLTWLKLSETGIQDISFVSGLTGLSILQISDCSVSDISPIAKCESLTWLELGGNLITDLSPMERLLKLTYVDLSRNQIRSISEMGNCAVLENINLSDNKIQNIDILAKSAGTLKIADISRNSLNITTFENVFNNCPVLETLSADNVGLVGTWNISYLPSIKALSLAENDIDSFILPRGTGTRLETLNLSGNKNLNKFNLYEANEWKNINISNTALETLNLVLPSSSSIYAKLLLANCAAVDLQYIPTDVDYSLLDIRSDTVYNAAFVSQLSGSEISIKYSADINCFNANALSDSKFYRINIYDAPLDMQEKIKNALQTKLVYFVDNEEAFDF